MFEDLKASLAKVEGSVRGAFTDTLAAIAHQRGTIASLEADLTTPLGRLESAAKKAESTVRARLEDVRQAAERLTR